MLKQLTLLSVSLLFQFSLSSYSIDNSFIPLTWNGEESFPPLTIFVNDYVQWYTAIPPDPNQFFTLQSMKPPQGSRYDLEFFPEFIQDNQTHYFNAQFTVAGNYSYLFQIRKEGIQYNVTGHISVVPGYVWNKDILYYDLLVGDILRWFASPNPNVEVVVYPDVFEGWVSAPGVIWNRFGQRDAYDYQFLIPGTYSYMSSPTNITVIQVHPGVNVHWSSSMAPISAKLWLNDVVRLIWTNYEEHSPTIHYYSAPSEGFEFPLGTFAQAGDMVNTTVQQGPSVQITEDPDHMNMRFESYQDIGPLYFVNWRAESNEYITISPQTTLRFYVTDNRKHNVRLNGPSMEMVSGNIQAPGTYVDILFDIPGQYRASCDYHPDQFVEITVLGEGSKPPTPTPPRPPPPPAQSTSVFVDSLMKYAEVSAIMIGILGLSAFLPQQTSCSRNPHPPPPPPPDNGGEKDVQEMTNVVLAKVTQREAEGTQQ